MDEAPFYLTRLWETHAPGAFGDTDHDCPSLAYYAPAINRATDAAMVIFPGGSYGFLAGHEGADYARWLTGHGFHAFVLQYRLGVHGYRHPIMLTDAARAIRLVRNRATRWGISPNKIGAMGSSAGGHLAAILATMRKDEALVTGDLVDDESPSPNLAVLCYPVITMGSLAHLESQHHLLGHEPSPAMCKRLSAEHRVTTQTPPCFIWHTVADEAVPVENSLLFAAALRRKRIPFELHLYEQGGHGLGLADGHPWTHACLAWLRRHFSLDRISPEPSGG